MSAKLTVISIFLLTGFMALMEACHSYQDSNEDISTTDTTGIAIFNKTAAAYAQGKTVFAQNCSRCHIPPEERIAENFTFDNIFDKLPQPSEQYFIKFLQDSKALQDAGDDYAITLHKEFGSDYEHNFKNVFSQQDLDGLIIYIKVAVQEKYRGEE